MSLKELACGSAVSMFGPSKLRLLGFGPAGQAPSFGPAAECLVPDSEPKRSVGHFEISPLQRAARVRTLIAQASPLQSFVLQAAAAFLDHVGDVQAAYLSGCAPLAVGAEYQLGPTVRLTHGQLALTITSGALSICVSYHALLYPGAGGIGAAVGAMSDATVRLPGIAASATLRLPPAEMEPLWQAVRAWHATAQPI